MSDNCWLLSFTRGEADTAGPLVGTDNPNTLQALGLLGTVQLPNFGSLVNVPGLQAPDVGGLGNVLQSHLRLPGVNLPDLGGLRHLP